jgi:putative oxidoreductase
MTWLDYIGIPFLVRLCLVVLFPFSALDKIINYKAALAQATSSWLPGGRVLLVLAIIVEVVTPLCILFAWHDRLAAFVLAGFCAITAVLYHPFWQFRDFWTPGDSKGRSHFWDFLKNFGLVGGLLLITLQGIQLPASLLAQMPLTSTMSYMMPPKLPPVPPQPPAVQ